MTLSTTEVCWLITSHTNDIINHRGLLTDHKPYQWHYQPRRSADWSQAIPMTLSTTEVCWLITSHTKWHNQPQRSADWSQAIPMTLSTTEVCWLITSHTNDIINHGGLLTDHKPYQWHYQPQRLKREERSYLETTSEMSHLSFNLLSRIEMFSSDLFFLFTLTLV
jgi:hypothetical protein